MPYIKKKQRAQLVDRQPKDAGELNYKITMLVWHYFRDQGGSYQQINDALGALEGAKLEFYRRVVVPYESKKIKDNGDVY